MCCIDDRSNSVSVSPLTSTIKLPAEPIEQEIERLPEATRRLAAQLILPVDLDAVWHVLTDYDHLTHFIPNLVSSKVLQRNGFDVVLEQEGSQRFAGLRFTAKVTLELRERRPDGMLDFRMVSGDFRRFEGAWFLCPDPNGGVRLRYEVLIQACRGMPIGLIEQRLKEDLSSNLRAVAAEALRRQQN
tara:strand:- start:157 stop:717 length:561 start_codon:yes stop_codon:yes gene_type:complete